MTNKVYIFDSHPIQYKAPVYQEMNRIAPDTFEVIYGTDVSVRSGSVDKGFGIEVKWDTPLLSGYKFRVLNNEKSSSLTTPAALSGEGVFQILRKERPAAVLLTQSRYYFDHTAYISAFLLGIPILIRQETQDEMYATNRSFLKSALRSVVYRLMYTPVKHAFCFGELNRQHLKKHGIGPNRTSTAHFSVANPLKGLETSEKLSRRSQIRQKFEIDDKKCVVSFFGKLIPKKNPDLIFESLEHLDESKRRNIHLLIVGTGELQDRLRDLALQAREKWNVQTSFAGFINQTQLPDYYLASDIVVLPSRRMGEAWGLVINEALHAGCSVVMTDAVGCQYEFGKWERARVIPEGDAISLAKAIDETSDYPRDLDWATTPMQDYSTESAATAVVNVYKKYIK